MPIHVPDLDDRSYDDLVREGVALIPRHSATWTDHNASDPGIMLIELLAYTAEQLIFRLDRIGRPTKARFLSLLTAEPLSPEWMQRPMAELDAALQRAVAALRSARAAVSVADHEDLALRASSAGRDRLDRVRAFAELDLERGDEDRDIAAPGHTSVVLVPARGVAGDDLAELVRSVQQELEEHRLLAARVHVVLPQVVQIRIAARVWARPGVDLEAGRSRLGAAIQAHFSMHAGWPFGRPFYLSEVYEQLERVDGVDHVDAVRVTHVSVGPRADDEATLGVQIGFRSTVGADTRLGAAPAEGRERYLRDSAGQLFGIALRPYELLDVTLQEVELRGEDRS